MAGSLSWSSAAKIAWRDMRSSSAKFAFVIVAVAIGVGALTGVRGASEGFKRTLLLRARTIMAADLSARSFQQPTAKQFDALHALSAHGAQQTIVTETVSMASAAGSDPLLISLKAVDPARYPFYGTVEMQPAGTLGKVLTDDAVVVADDLLVRMHVGVGSVLKIGGKPFRIAAVLVNEPDRLTAPMGLGPRVLITQAAMEGAGLLQPGSRAGERILFKLPPPKDDVDAIKKQVEAILPEAQVTDFRETNPALTQGLERSTSLLSLISLVAMVLGAIGVAMAMHAHLEQRVDTIAIMKSLGARSSQVMRIYLLQTLLLGLVGGAIGVALGALVQRAFPLLLRHLIPIEVQYQFPLRAVLVGLLTGLLTTLLFTLPPLLDIRKVRPSLILRRAVEQPETRKTLMEALAGAKARIIAAALIVLGLALIASTLTDSAEVGRDFAIALISIMLFLLLFSAASLWLLRRFLRATRMRLPSAVRHGLANVHRPGNQSAAVLAALGTGVMLIMTVFLMQQAIRRELGESSNPGLPNVFLVDISTREVNEVKHLVAAQPGVSSVETVPVAAARLVSINGAPLEQMTAEHFPKRMLHSASLSYAETLPTGIKISAGKWWAKTASEAEIAVDSRLAARMKVGVGTKLVFEVGGRTVPMTVQALFTSDGQHVYGRSPFITPPAVLAGSSVIWYGAAHVVPTKVGALQRALYAQFPTVTVINMADAFQLLRGVVDQIATIIRFLAAFSIFAGGIILASSIASTRFRRVREVVVLKTLGATRQRIAVVFSVEFLLLGSLAGLVGVVFANLLTRALLHKLEAVFRIEWLAAAVAIAGTALIATATGWLASYRMLGQKPLEVLRED